MEIDPPPVGVFEPPTPKSNRLSESSLFMFMVIDCFVADYVEIVVICGQQMWCENCVSCKLYVWSSLKIKFCEGRGKVAYPYVPMETKNVAPPAAGELMGVD